MSEPAGRAKLKGPRETAGLSRERGSAPVQAADFLPQEMASLLWAVGNEVGGTMGYDDEGGNGARPAWVGPFLQEFGDEVTHRLEMGEFESRNFTPIILCVAPPPGGSDSLVVLDEMWESDGR
jgi:hypothetical protein